MDICSATTVANGTIHCCTLPTGHRPANEHRSEYVELNTSGAVKKASYSWTGKQKR